MEHQQLNPAKPRCVDVARDGIKPAAGFAPSCSWPERCKVRGCFWRAFHQLPPINEEQPEQENLF